MWYAPASGSSPGRRVNSSLRMVTILSRSPGLSCSRVSKSASQPVSQSSIMLARVSPSLTNSESRNRSGFSPSVVRKSVQREREVSADVLDDYGEGIGFGIDRAEKLLVGDLVEGLFGHLFIALESLECIGRCNFEVSGRSFRDLREFNKQVYRGKLFGGEHLNVPLRIDRIVFAGFVYFLHAFFENAPGEYLTFTQA